MSDGFEFLWIVFYEELTLEIRLSFGSFSISCRFLMCIQVICAIVIVRPMD